MVPSSNTMPDTTPSCRELYIYIFFELNYLYIETIGILYHSLINIKYGYNLKFVVICLV